MPFYSPATGGFYAAEIHGRNIPEDAIKISAREHRELVLAVRQGHEIEATKSGLVVRRSHEVDGTALTLALKRVKREARARILNIASLEQQSNDNAALALAALGEGDSTVSAAARERRHKIDAVRAASNLIEAGLAGHTADELAAFDAAAAAWPE